jgi:hypothetical protein
MRSFAGTPNSRRDNRCPLHVAGAVLGGEAKADRARLLGLTSPPAANRAWERVYRDIVDQAPWLPTVTPTWTDFISRRAGNYQFHPLWGILIDQLWVR